MTFLHAAVALLGLYLVILSQQPLSSTLTLIWGIIVILLVLADLRPVFARWHRAPPP